MAAETSWVEQEDYSQVPLNIIFSVRCSYGEKILFLHPYNSPPKSLVEEQQQQTLAVQQNRPYNTKRDRNQPVPKQAMRILDTRESNTLLTEFGLTARMVADLGCANPLLTEKKFEVKVDNFRFVGWPLKVTHPNTVETFAINFVVAPNADAHMVDSLQRLCKRLAIAIDSQQTLNGYLDQEELSMKTALEAWERVSPGVRTEAPWNHVLEASALAKLLHKVYEDAKKTGAIQVFIDDFIEIGFCIEPKAYIHAHLTPKNRSDIEKIVAGIRPYHGCLLLENQYPTPDGNPAVQRFLEYNSPDRSFEDLSYVSGMPLLQILLIMKHLLLWARAIVIYPLCDSNVYTSATRPKPLNKQINKFQHLFGTNTHLANALAAFNPPARLDSFVKKQELLTEQHSPACVVVFLLRHQLIMQLHKFCYIIPPLSGTALPQPPSSEKRIQDIKAEIDNGDLPSDVKDIVVNICLEMLNTESLSKVKSKLGLFLQMAPFMKGENHIEDIMYRLNVDRTAVEDVIEAFSLVLSTFHRPDHIAL